MNIFKALSQGDGTINETNVTSFLSYVFNETTEFSSSFLFLFLEQIDKQLNNDGLGNIIESSYKNYRDRINKFKGKYSFSSTPEKRITQDNVTLDIDILLTISDKEKEDDICYFLIENKIKKSALKEDQCCEQYNLFKKIEDFDESLPVFSVLISPDLDLFKPMIEKVKEQNKLSAWLKWHST